jgi:hypothetical protein
MEIYFMAKKQKRPIRKDANPTVEKTVADPLMTNRTTAFNPDYQYVVRDLRRVGILAGSFVIVLVVLAIFIH